MKDIQRYEKIQKWAARRYRKGAELLISSRSPGEMFPVASRYSAIESLAAMRYLQIKHSKIKNTTYLPIWNSPA